MRVRERGRAPPAAGARARRRTPSASPSAIRPAKPSDLPAIVELELACFEPYRRASRQSLGRSLRSNRQSVWVADGPDRLYALLVVWHLAKALRVYDIATHPDARGLGLGSRLMAHAESLARKGGADRIILEAEEQDPRLVGWYEAQGFLVTDRFVDYYHRGCSAVRMEKALRPHITTAQ